MAQLSNNVVGFVVILEHSEVDAAATVASTGADMTAFLASKIPGIPALILGVVSRYLAATAALIKAMDLGRGIYLTMPYLTPGLVIPTPRGPDIGPPADWVSRGSGQFATEDGDRISYEVRPNTTSTDAVAFRLLATNRRMWRKVLVIRDGEGSQWDITIDPSRGVTSAENGLWAHQVKYGQHFSFWKAKQFAVNVWVLDIADLATLPPGSTVDFTWLHDPGAS